MLLTIKKEYDFVKFNYYINLIFNEEMGGKLDVINNNYKEDFFFAYLGEVLVGGFRLVYGEGGLPLAGLNVELSQKINPIDIIEPGRLFICKEFRGKNWHKYLINFIDYYVLNYKKDYSYLLIDSILRAEVIYKKLGYQRFSLPFFDPSVSDEVPNAIILFKRVSDFVIQYDFFSLNENLFMAKLSLPEALSC